MSGSQSMNVMCTTEPLRFLDHTEASRRTKKARENCVFCISTHSYNLKPEEKRERAVGLKW